MTWNLCLEEYAEQQEDDNDCDNEDDDGTAAGDEDDEYRLSTKSMAGGTDNNKNVNNAV